MPTGYGHNTYGINIQNLRALASTPTFSTTNHTLLPGGLRTDSSWKREVDEFKLSVEHRSQLSSRVRSDNQDLQATAQQQVEASVGRVEAALQSKLAKTQTLAQSLEQALSAVNHEHAGLSRSQQRLNAMVAHLKQKADINRSRQQARCDRPARELTCDEVSRTLARQHDLLANLLERLQRGVALVTVDMDKLNSCRQQMNKDLKDKVAALKVDEMVLAVKPDHSPPAATNSAKVGARASKASSSGRCSHNWEHQTTSLVQEAQHLAADASRLRKAVKQLLQEAHNSTQQITQQLDGAMACKLKSADLLRDELNVQLHQVQHERSRATRERDSLRKSLQDKMAPLQQLEARFSIRAAHPSSAAVDDEVQYALAAEAAQLSGVCTQLAQRVDAADTQIHRLDELSAALLSNIADKEVAMTLEERVAMLDGRLCPAVPPTPSVLSVCSSVASGYSRLGDSASQVGSRVSTPSTRAGPADAGHNCSPSRLKGSPTRGPPGKGGSEGSTVGSGCSVSSSANARIAALEQELAQAKVETEHLQKTIRVLKVGESRPQTPGSHSAALGQKSPVK